VVVVWDENMSLGKNLTGFPEKCNQLCNAKGVSTVLCCKSREHFINVTISLTSAPSSSRVRLSSSSLVAGSVHGEGRNNKTREENHIKLYFIIFPAAALVSVCEIDQRENEKSRNGK
jgi:hypothetical protein